MNYTAVILAAGSGTRMNLGYNKMFYKIKNKPLISLSTQHFYHDSDCSEIIIVCNENEDKDIKNILINQKLWNDKCKIVNGSYERQYSVYNGLQHVSNDIVLVHDGARPFISKSLIAQLVEEANINGCAIPGVKVKDTIKYVNNLIVEKTLPREHLYAVQTPQACQTKLLLKAHKLAKEEQFLGTDEASLIEKYTTSTVRIVNSSYENIKITTQDDLANAESLYEKYF